MRFLRARLLRLALPTALVVICPLDGHAASKTVTVLQWNVVHGGRGTDNRVDPGRQVN